MEFNFEDKLQELSEDKEFLEKVCSAEDPEQVKALFLEKDIEMDVEAANAFVEKIRSMDGEELDEEALENVSGGFLGLCAVGTIAAWAIVGAVAGIAIAALCLYAYKKLKYDL